MLIISVLPVVNCETMVGENKVSNKPTTTQKMVDHKMEVLMAERRRSNFGSSAFISAWALMNN